MLNITWLEPRTGDGWSIWETECGQYRIDQVAPDRYTPRRLNVMPGNGVITERFWEYIGPDMPTLSDAQGVINRYHCETYNLVLVA